MNILYTINDAFVPQVAAGITSVCENNKEIDSIVFYIIGQGISEDNQNRLNELVSKYNRGLEIIEIDELDNYIDFEFDTSGWNSIVLARLLIGKLLPEDVNRILYLDGDTIVLDKLDKLWNRDLRGKTLAMCSEPTFNRKRRQNLGLDNYYYHNAGVFLADLKRWREIDAQKIILEYYKENDGKLFANDQDAINASMKDEIVELLPKYNFSNIYTTYPYSFMKKLAYPKKYISNDLYMESVNNPVIIHYLGEERPWRKGNRHKFKDDYTRYLGMTFWKDTPEENGWQFYFILWYMFNFIMKPFPYLRYQMIDRMIPIFLKIKSKKK